MFFYHNFLKGQLYVGKCHHRMKVRTLTLLSALLVYLLRGYFSSQASVSSFVSCLDVAMEKAMATHQNPRDGGAWWAAVYGVPQGEVT